MVVFVRDNHIEQANKILKRKMQKAGVYKEMRFRKHYEKPSEIKTRKRAEKEKKIVKFLKKRMEKEGF
jgi:small subunit ribosomal protein S21